MWDLAVNLLLSIITECIRTVSTATYRTIQRKLKAERLVDEMLKEAGEGNLRLGDNVKVVGVFSEYMPVTNLSQFLSEYRQLKFLPRNPIDKSDGEPIDKNYCGMQGRFLTKWLQDGPAEIYLPTATTRFDSIENVYVGSVLPHEERFAYGPLQIPVFYSADYCENSIDLLNVPTGTAEVMDCVVVPVPQQFRKILSNTVPTLTREDGLSVPFGLKVLRPRKLPETRRIYINHWVLGHFASERMKDKEIWRRIVWEDFLKGNTSIYIGDGSDEGRRKVLPHFATHDYLEEIMPIVFKQGQIEHDVYLTAMLIKPCLFQLSLAKAPADVIQIRNEFISLAEGLMSQEYFHFLTDKITIKVDYQSDQRTCLWQAHSEFK